MKSRKLLFLTVLLLPLAANAGDKVKREGVLIEGPVRVEDSWVGEGTPTGVKAKNWVFVVKVGDYQFTGLADRIGGIFASKGPQDADWPQNSTIKLVFHHRMGSLYMDLKSPSGKEEENLWVFSKKGADGKELCGKFKCEGTAEDSED